MASRDASHPFPAEIDVLGSPSGVECAGGARLAVRLRGNERRRMPGRESRGDWPKCGARTRRGHACRAAGAAFGGRCLNHGGGCGGHIHDGRSRRFVLFTGVTGVTDHVARSRWHFLALPVVARRRWHFLALPVDLWERLPTPQRERLDPVALGDRLCEVGVRRDVADSWPQALGWRCITRLARRGLVAFVLVADRKGILRAQRERPPAMLRRLRKVDSETFARALSLAGTRPRGVRP